MSKSLPDKPIIARIEPEPQISSAQPKPCFCIILSDGRNPDKITNCPYGLHRRSRNFRPSHFEVLQAFDRAVAFIQKEIHEASWKVCRSNQFLATFQSRCYRSQDTLSDECETLSKQTEIFARTQAILIDLCTRRYNFMTTDKVQQRSTEGCEICDKFVPFSGIRTFTGGRY